IGPCNAAFSPSAEDVAQAKKIIAAFDLPENEHKGVVQLDGRMVERLHADMARRTVAIAQAIEQRRLEPQPLYEGETSPRQVRCLDGQSGERTCLKFAKTPTS